MLDGLSYLFGQVSVLLLVALGLGILAGRFVWPARAGAARGPHDTAAPGPAGTASPATHPVGSSAPAAAGSFVAGGAGTPHAPAVGSPGPAPGAPPQGGDDRSGGQLAQAEAVLGETRRRLAQADAEVMRLRAQAQALADQKEAEMGRLESGAIAALESTISAHGERVAALEVQLRAAEEAARSQDQQLDAERRRSSQLQAALAERDEHLATLTAGIDERERSGRASRPETDPAR